MIPLQYKTELHCHSRPVSPCSRFSPEALAQYYIEAGYTTVVLTNHFCSVVFSPKYYNGAPDLKSRVDYFLEDYRSMKQAAGDRLHVLLGAEFRINGHAATDYLVYGLTEELLYTLGDVTEGSMKEFSARVHEAGCMLYQAHPFRNGMLITDPALLDGIEVYNATPRGLSRNDFAMLWADTFGLKKIAGTDFHGRNNAEFPNGEHARSGILTDAPILTNEALLTVLNSGNYELLCGDSSKKTGNLK